MKILLTGANGFIGRHLLARLVAAGHEVMPAVRHLEETDRLLPKPTSIRVDLNRDTTPETWLPRLVGIDAVVNCAGVLQGSHKQKIAAIHADAPIALFRACAAAGVRRVIQISAISAVDGAGTAYAASKKEADDFLAASGDTLDWIVLRPSLVYARGAYGGTALFRALAALPLMIPLVGSGQQVFQPLHVDDLADAVLHALETPSLRGVIIDPVGPEQLTLHRILTDLRRWLGYAPVPTLALPLWLIAAVACIGDLLGGTINTTALKQLQFGNAGDVAAFTAATGIRPRRWSDALLAEPAQLQDRWHARLYFLRPLLRLAIAATWIVSGIVGLISEAALAQSVKLFGTGVSVLAMDTTCLADIAIGLLVLRRWRPVSTAAVQTLLIVAYTAFLTGAEPSLWLEPFGPLLKNIPFAAAVLMLAAIEVER
ncbi:MAG: NAD(P)H-binding protein [Alphaproteobacteria bacterium]|nr:NAD(P)H-binding protein [Alphaproteobacteria bacterium]